MSRFFAMLSDAPSRAWPLAALLVAGCVSLQSYRSGRTSRGVFDDADLTPLERLTVLDEPGFVVASRGGGSLPIVACDSRRAVDAARRLALLIRRSTGVKPEVIREFPGAPATNRFALFVGSTAAAAERGLVAPGDSPESFRVVASGGSVFFLGREDYAVFDWCERQLGVRCFWYDPGGDELSVPKRGELRVEAVDYSDRPLYGMRVCGSCASQRWAKFAKAGNTHRGGVNVHAPHGWHKDAALVAEHPEIFARDQDGRRAMSPLLCYGNPETLVYYEQRIDEAIAGVRDSGGIVDVKRKVITVSPWDVAYNCTCAHCTPLYDESLGQSGNASPIVWRRFLKPLARWAKERHPDYIVSFLPYWNMCEVPAGLDLREEGNCEAEVCVMPGLALMKDEPVARREEALIRRWTEVTGRKAILWHYTCWPAEFTVAPYLFGHEIRRHWLGMRGVADGCFICGGGEVPRLSLMHYIWMRCMWNPEVDVDAVYDRFAERMFGAAARPMRRLISLQESGWSRRWNAGGISDGNIYGISYPPWVVREMKSLLASAERLARGDAESFRRVRRYASIFAGFFDEAAKVHAGSPNPVFEMALADKPPVIDGLLNDACWGKARPHSFVRAMDGICTKPAYPTEMRGARCEGGFAFAFRFDEPAVAAMPSGEWIDDHENHDVVNLFLTDAAKADGPVFRLRFDADGRLSLFNGFLPRANGGVRLSVRKGDSSWSAELFVPFDAIGGEPSLPRGNVSRWRVGDSCLGPDRRAPGSTGEWTRFSTRFSTSNFDRCAFSVFNVPRM